MDQKKLPITPFKESAPDSPKNDMFSNYPKSAHNKNQYINRKFSDYPAISNTPDSSVFKQFNTISKTKCSTKLDFNSTDPKSDNQLSSLFYQRKLKQESNVQEPDMDVEVSDFTLSLTRNEDIRKEKPSPFHEFPKNINTPKKDMFASKPVPEEFVAEEYQQPKQKQPLIK